MVGAMEETIGGGQRSRLSEILEELLLDVSCCGSVEPIISVGRQGLSAG